MQHEAMIQRNLLSTCSSIKISIPSMRSLLQSWLRSFDLDSWHVALDEGDADFDDVGWLMAWS